MTSSSVSVDPGVRTTQATAASPHFGCGDADDGRLGDLGVAHQLVLEFDRADPLAARLDQVLGAVDEPDPATLVDRRDVAGAQPAVGGEALRAARSSS